MLLLFADIETTGLVPEDDRIIEVGFSKVTDNLEWRASVSTVIHLSGIDAWQDYEPPLDVPKRVVEMHRSSGLWKESYESKTTLRAAENELIKWIIENNLRNLPLVGNTIGFDRGFLRIHMPRLHDLFHHRSLDISSIKIASNMWTPRTEGEEAPLNLKRHRVIPDMQDSLNELRFYRAKNFNGPWDRSWLDNWMVPESE